MAFHEASNCFDESEEELVAYAFPSSRPYSWQGGGAFMNYGQWKQGAMWAVAYYDLGSRDADIHAKHSEMPASAHSPPQTHEKA